MEIDERWGSLLDGLLDEADRRELLATAASELNRVVAQRGGVGTGLLDTIGSVVESAQVSGQLGDEANRAFELALGPQPARLVNWLVADANHTQRLDEIRPLLDPPSAVFLTDLLVRYGDRLERASYLFLTQAEHDWRLVNREISVDRATGRITIRLRIAKYNGEICVIEGRPDSILALADAMLSAVNAVGDRAAFLQDLGPFMETVEQTITMFTPEEAQPEPTNAYR